MKKIKLAQVITRMDWAGSSDIVRVLSQGLDKNIYEVKLIIGKSKNLTLKNQKFLEDFKNNIIKIPFLRREINPFFDFIAFILLYLIFKKEKFDIIHTHTSKAGFLGRISAKLASRAKTIYMPHGHIFYGYFNPLISRLFIFLEKLGGFFTDRIIALTELEKRDFLSLGIKKSEFDITVVPSGIEIGEILEVREEAKEKLRKELGFDLEETLVGMVSRLELVKGPIYFIEAIPYILKKFAKAKFLVVGEGAQLGRLIRRAKELGIEKKVLFLGWRQNVLEILSILDVLVQPSLNEAVGRVLLEAQLLGIPVVATNVGGIPEVVRDRRSGLLVKAGDSQALAKAVIELLEDGEKRKTYSRAGQNWVRENFSFQKMVEKIDRIYKSLLSNEHS